MAEKKNIKALYDTVQHLVHQAELNAGKDGTIDKSVIPPIAAAFNDIIEFQKTYLIMQHDQFYGMMLMSMETELDFSQRGAVDIKVKRQPFVVSFNPMFCAKYTFAEFTGLLISEILKLAYEHPSTYASVNKAKDSKVHEMLDKAGQASVSEMVQDDIRLDADSPSRSKMLRLPKDATTVSKLNEELSVTPKNRESIEYYYKLLERFSKKNNPNSSDGGTSPMSLDGNGSQSQDIASPTNQQGNGTHQWEGIDPDEQKENLKSMIREVFNNLDERSRGLMPAGLLSQIKALLAPPQISWKQILRRLVGAVPVPYRKTRTRLNRRQPFRADLCGKLPKRIVNVVTVFDTSGSMSDSDLKYCMNEVFNILKEYEGAKITVIECDAEINRVYQCNSMKNFKTKMKGRKGTSFIPAIEFINGDKRYKDIKDKDIDGSLSGHFRDALMVYFTDGYGDYEIPKPKTYRNLWVVLNGENNLSLKNPYGDVKSLSTDKDWLKQKNGF